MSDDVPRFTAEVCARLREALRHARYDADGVAQLLGAAAHAALGRGELEPAYRASAQGGALGTFVRLFLLGAAESRTAVAHALAPLAVDDAVAAGLLRAEGDLVHAIVDVRPHADEQGSWWVLSDMDSSPTYPAVGSKDHVGGIGQAAISLVRATPRRQVDSVLDLGTGNGVQALHAARRSRSITATDVSTRALALAEGAFRLNEIDVELLRGPWFTPVARRRFEQIVCNPPFVVGPPRVDYTYRDSGLTGDDASAHLIRQLPSFLADGGTGHVLASWLHRDREDWTERVANWLPPHTDAWFVQRDVADPALYVGTWLRDAGIEPASAQGRAKSAEWLNWFEHTGANGVGFGFVTLRRLDAEADQPTVVCEDLRHAYDDPLGAESDAWLGRVAWLRSRPDLLDATFAVPSTVVLEQICEHSDQGWWPTVRRLHRMDGPGWQHEVDELAAALLAGCRGELPLTDLLALLATAHDEPTDELIEAALPTVRQLVLHGMLVPNELAPPETTQR